MKRFCHAVRVCLPVAAALLAQARAGAGQEEPFLGNVDLSAGKVLLASNNAGEVLTFEPTSGRLRLWGPKGNLLLQRQLADPRLQGQAWKVALREHRALVSFFEQAANDEESYRNVVVDLDDGRVMASFFLPGVVIEAVGAKDGWALWLRQFAGQTAHPPWGFWLFSLELVSDEGKAMDQLVLPMRPEELAKAEGLPGHLPSPVKPLGVGAEVWVIPGVSYQLWRPKQANKSASVLHPPACLAAKAQVLSGEDARQELARRVEKAPEEVKAAVLRSLPPGGPRTGMLTVAAAAASFGRWAVVVVRGGQGAGCRLDLWDLGAEKLIRTMPLEEGLCPAFGSLYRDGVWLRKQSRLERLPLDLTPEEVVPCPTPAPSPSPRPGRGAEALPSLPQ